MLERSASNLPQGAPGQDAYFNVSGRIIITSVVGEVTTIIEGVAVSIKLVANPTVGADVDLCTAVVINGDAVGTIYTITGSLSDAMVATTSAAASSQTVGVLVTDGTIDLYTDINATGQTKWSIHYIPVDKNSEVTVN